MSQPSQGTNNPKTLYDSCLCCYVNKLNYNVSTLNSIQSLLLPPSIHIDVYVLMSQEARLRPILFEQLSEMDMFGRLLRFNPARQKLFHCLTILMSSGKPLAAQLQQNFTMRYQQQNGSTKTNGLVPNAKVKSTKYSGGIDNSNSLSAAIQAIIIDPGVIDLKETDEVVATQQVEAENENILAQADIVDIGVDEFSAVQFDADALDLGLRLGTFLSEAGWLTESIKVLQCVAANIRKMNPTDTSSLIIRLDCLQRLLHAESALCSFKSAERTYNEIFDLVKKLGQDEIPSSLLANIFTQFSAMYFARSEYDYSQLWMVEAVRNLNENTPKRIAIDVLRQAAKACVVKRDFHRANMLICQATCRARKFFGVRHQKYADALLDYGFFLLNVDSVYQSVKVYKEALDIKVSAFGDRNFHVGIAHEDLSYAYYVHEYSTGNFVCARTHVELAVDIMKDLVPSDHLMLASAKRVKALLLEEIALDKMEDGVDVEGLLEQSEELHKFALQLSLQVFGEVNVQTAKHYGNLGRLYQTMNRFDEAERMHQKAIKIKTDLLGPYDYEVGLSIGHLASLYNYQMKKYREAEDLYLRSIEISLRLFGRSYSGLEYDYLGLCHVYETLRDFEKYLKFAAILENWQILRGQNLTSNKSIYPAIDDDCGLEDVKHKFFNMSSALNLKALI